MPKTRRTKTNRSPGHPFGGRNSRAKVYVAEKGEMVATTGVRGRTVVTRVTDEAGKRISTIRVVKDVKLTPAKPVGDRKPRGIFIGRRYTGVARGKTYPYRGKKRGGVDAPAPAGLLARAGRALKRVVVKDEAAK